MPQTEFTGKNTTISFDPGNGVVTLDGVLDGTINETGKGAVEQLDVTVYGDTTYTFINDPLGPKGAPKATVTVTLQDSKTSWTDNEAAKIPLNDPGTLTIVMAQGTSNANKYTHTAIELTKRVTTIPFDGLATLTLTFEANSLGTWGKVT